MKALETQVGGSHYKTLAIQPVEYNQRNGLGFCEGSVVKYVTRWRDKGGIQDLEKAKHFIDLLIDIERKTALAEKQIELEYAPEGAEFKHGFDITPEEDEVWRESEKRIDAIGQNGNTGEHYVPDWASAIKEESPLPEWAKALHLNTDGDVTAVGAGRSKRIGNINKTPLKMTYMAESWRINKNV